MQLSSVYILLLSLLSVSLTLAQNYPYGVMAVWDFENPNPLTDRIGGRTGFLLNGAAVTNGLLVTVAAKSQVFYYNETFNGLADKTLEGWVKLTSLTQCCPGVAGIGIDGNTFDTIVYNEMGGSRWLAGSDYWHRSAASSTYAETEAATRFVHIVVTYTGNVIRVYREGILLENYVMANPPVVYNGNYNYLVGFRHPWAANGYLDGFIDEVRFYNRPLTQTEIISNWCSKVAQPATKILDVEMIVGTQLTTMQINTKAGTGNTSIYATSNNANVATVTTVTPAVGKIGSNHTLTYVAGSTPGAAMIFLYHSDSSLTCVSQTFFIKVFPNQITKSNSTCTANNGFVYVDKCFVTYNTPSITWSAANEMCKNLGGNLASIRTDAENNAVRSQVPLASSYWIGLNDRYVEASYNWVDGTPLTYNKWRTNEPDNANYREDCTEVLDAAGGWNDQRCDYTGNNYYVCQFALKN